ncbi:MAG: hypothetical protein EZS28_004370 [Streblomastix strix]|uniref:Uncharacterized protein n=1 Tax=Streblomastix strix TaxID=222440 RepID=A0A5J4WYB9_9EUKA|nr:MAG: hypothetical protein EZS28_004370 [Streblomastix strix]
MILFGQIAFLKALSRRWSAHLLYKSFTFFPVKYFEQLFGENKDNPAAGAVAPSVVDPPNQQIVASHQISSFGVSFF